MFVHISCDTVSINHSLHKTSRRQTIGIVKYHTTLCSTSIQKVDRQTSFVIHLNSPAKIMTSMRDRNILCEVINTDASAIFQNGRKMCLQTSRIQMTAIKIHIIPPMNFHLSVDRTSHDIPGSQ